jgi:hypothetical protein
MLTLQYSETSTETYMFAQMNKFDNTMELMATWQKSITR